MSFIETQKELARKKFWQNPQMAFMKQGIFDGQISDIENDIDTLVSQILTNVGEELVKRCNGEKYPEYWVGDEEMMRKPLEQMYNKAVDDTITIIKSVTELK